MKTLLTTWLLDALGLLVVDGIMNSISFSAPGALIITALVLALLNATVKPILKVLTFPLAFLTLGLFYWIINALIVYWSFVLSSGSFISGFGSAMLASLLLSLINMGLNKLMKG
ncbi:MAG: phage holin family protein [Solobacterium sp.]|jgi:putative membrane protein|nr:phage holin family protein [Solobacterium sp.]MCH4049982.1 phage holin family protein [Solobacterium sp.]MCH4073667.1 phage holin family protein [Solobacterium sp.]MCI1313156.1 phage holin family protein [Solobacterium sp.]MCI1346734.1 phage holin family protein [Solobacterium sp.]